jgi:hypothetical protein
MSDDDVYRIVDRLPPRGRALMRDVIEERDRLRESVESLQRVLAAMNDVGLTADRLRVELALVRPVVEAAERFREACARLPHTGELEAYDGGQGVVDAVDAMRAKRDGGG